MYKIGDTFDVDGKACRIISQAEVYNFGWKQTIFVLESANGQLCACYAKDMHIYKKIRTCRRIDNGRTGEPGGVGPSA